MRQLQFLFASFLVAHLAVLLTPPPTLAQGDPPILQGLKPYDSLHGGDIDTISASNGTLDIHAPLFSFPQRGDKLPFGFSIRYAASGFSVQKQTLPPPINKTQTEVYWNGNWVQVVPDTSYQFNASLWQGWAPIYYAISPDRSSHQMGQAGSYWESLDATGFRFNANAYVLSDSAGIRYTFSPDQTFTDPIKVEDTNGNYITHSNGIWTDTLSRQIPDPLPGIIFNNPGISFTGCPQGAVPTVATIPWTIPSPGGSVTLQFCYATYTLNFDLPGDTGQVRYPVVKQKTTLLQGIVLPNGTAWTFDYDLNLGVPTKIVLPTGGSISYSGRVIRPCPASQSGYPQHYLFVYTSRTVDANDGTGPHTWTIMPTTPSDSWNSPVTITAPDQTKSVQTLYGLAGCAFFEKEADSYDASGTLLKVATTDYSYSPSPTDNFGIINLVPIRTTTTWPNGPVTKSEKDYDSGFTFSNYSTGTYTPAVYGLLVAERSYNYGSGSPGPLLRQTKTSYAWQSNSNYLTANLLSLPSQVVTYDGNGNRVAETDSTYDNPSYLQASNITTQHEAAPGPVRGNLTFLQRWVNTTNSFITSTTTMFDTGTLPTTTDPLSHAVARSYSASFAGAYATTVTNALSQSANRNYDFNTGLLASTTDPNNLTTSFSYDNMWRLSQVTHPDGGTEIISHQETTFPFSATLTKQINSAQSEINTHVFDGLGRLTQSQLTSDPQGTVYTDTTYDALGRVATVSNPYRSGTDITTSTGITTYGYDALGRKISETYPDNSVLTTAYCGPSTLVTDPTGRWRRSRVDGLGRLVEVDEPNAPGASVNSNGCPGTGEPIWVTTYGYDALGNLTSVLQNGSRQRSFTYDSLSRLLTATNPETGTITYAYNSDGVLISKTDARNITTTYSPSDSPIDVLHRVTKITYSNGDPSIIYAYDQAACLGLSTCQNIGHRTSMNDAGGSEAWSYHVDATNPDTNKRTIRVDQRTTNSSPSNITKTSTYYFDLAGNVTQAVYPTGRVVNYTYDNANRPSTAVDGSNGITYANDFQTAPTGCLTGKVCYTPQGTFYVLSIGQTSFFSGLNLSHSYNSRLQPNEFKASSTGGNAIDITYGFVDPSTNKNAGHVYSITNNLDTTRSQTFTYDSLNRIASALTASTHATSPTHCWGEVYGNDAWGNLLSIAATTNSNYTGCSQESGFTANADGNNHLTSFSYDASGNATSDGTYSYSWDGESQLKSAAGVNYLYDGDGRRVSKSNGKLYWYGSGGDILAETDAVGNVTAEYIFFDGKRIAMLPASGTPIYYVEDLLGTSRVTTTNTGVVCYDADFYPYGGERSYTNTCPQNYKFAGKERDAESGLDYFGARYYGSALGRFVTPDWAAKATAVPYADFGDPQSLNLYAYVRNNPLSKADPDGHCGTPSGLKPGGVGVCVASYISSNTVGVIGRGDGRGPNGQGGTSRIETRLVVDPSQHTATKTNETINRSGIIIKDFGPQGKGGSTVSSTQTDKEGNTYFQVSQDAHSSYSMGGAVLGSIDNHLNLAVTPDGKVGIDPGSSAKDFPSLEVYRYTVDDKGNVTTTQVFTKQESGHVSDLKQPEKPIKPQEPK
jgi:RHS repeat-associated protein